MIHANVTLCLCVRILNNKHATKWLMSDMSIPASLTTIQEDNPNNFKLAEVLKLLTGY